MTDLSLPPRNLPRSFGTILAGFVAVFVLSLGTDLVFHALALSSLPCAWHGAKLQRKKHDAD